MALNCIAESNGAYGYNGTNTNSIILRLCAAYGNATADFNLGTGITADVGSITGSSSFFTDAGGGDFSLNNTAGAGASLREAGFPGALIGLAASTGYIDIGVFQSQGGSGGGEHSAVF